MLTLYEYSSLPLNEKAETLWQHGEFLTNVDMGNVAYSLHAVFKFYVEITIVGGQMTDFTPFIAGPRLDKYLPFISLTER